jgi:hypothetical protein
MWDIMNVCVTMHNIITQSEREHPVLDIKPYHRRTPFATVDHQVPVVFAAFLTMRQEIRDANTHNQLQDDLVDAQRKCCLVLFFVFYLFGSKIMYYLCAGSMLL